MPYAAAHSRSPRLADAVRRISAQVRGRLGGARPDLSFVFVSHHHAEQFEELAATLQEQTGSRVLAGCTGEAIVGGGEEIESAPAVSLWSAVLSAAVRRPSEAGTARRVVGSALEGPPAEIEPFHLQFEQTADGILCTGFPESGGAPANAVFFFGEPFTSAPKSVIQRAGEEFPGAPLIGGMASGGERPGQNRLFLNSETIEHGGVGVVLRGGLGVRTIVSQGCRPIGTHFVVTRAEENIVIELGGRPALERIQSILPTLPPRDQMLARRGLHLGIAMSEYKERFQRGDFLIANVIGADPDSGAIAIAGRVRVGQTVQLHVRDAETADEDLIEMLDRDAREHRQAAQAGLLFTCNGRGTRLFPMPNHDAAAIQEHAGPIPLAGFFAQGELGPVDGRNYIHGFTASVALFE